MAAQARNFPLKKPGGFHWDFFLLGCTSFIAGIIDIPLPNGLVPQVRSDLATLFLDDIDKYAGTCTYRLAYTIQIRSPDVQDDGPGRAGDPPTGGGGGERGRAAGVALPDGTGHNRNDDGSAARRAAFDSRRAVRRGIFRRRCKPPIPSTKTPPEVPILRIMDISGAASNPMA